MVPPEEPVTELAEHGTLAFENVDLTYPGADVPVVRDVSFEARPGQTVAIIGSTGAGKTTMVNLVPRLFELHQVDTTMDAAWGFPIDDFSRWRLMEGLDDIGLTLRHEDAITSYEETRPAFKPVVV